MGQVEGIYDQRSSIGIALTKLRFRAQRYLSRPEKIMGLILLGVLIILVVLPLVQIFIGASTFSYNDTRLVHGATPGAWTVYHWQRVVAGPLSRVLLFKPLLNSLSIALGTVLVALPLGSLLAWLVAAPISL